MQKKYINRLLLSLFSSLVLTSVQASQPLWTVAPAPGNNPTQVIPINGDATVSYIVENQSSKPKTLVMQRIKGVTKTAPCVLAPKGQPGSSCTLNLVINSNSMATTGIYGGPVVCEDTLNGSSNPNQCYQPSRANSLQITSSVSTTATISVTPTSVTMGQNTSSMVRVVNSASSGAAANSIVATIPNGSNLTVQSTDCGASLPIGAGCNIVFQSTTIEGPTPVSIAGTNTNTLSLNITVSNLPLISITGPVQQSRIVTVSGMTPLALQVTNDSAVTVTNIVVSDKTACPALAVDATNCVSVLSGATCTLNLTSATPYAPCNIAVSGTGTGNSPTTLIAFEYLGGLVFEENAGSGKILIDVAQQFNSWWTDSFNNIAGAFSLNNGSSNTDAIVASTDCTDNPDDCAALSCRNISPNWYLPAIRELTSVYDAFCSNGDFPCNFGQFTGGGGIAFYWSSSQSADDAEARVINFFGGATNPKIPKNSPLPVRCTRTF